METAFDVPLTIPSGASASNSYHVGKHVDEVFAVSVQLPADLLGVASFAYAVSMDNDTFFTLFDSTGTAFISTLDVSGVTALQDAVKFAMLGWGYFRIVPNTAPTADLEVRVRFASRIGLN